MVSLNFTQQFAGKGLDENWLEVWPKKCLLKVKVLT
jgi:hypothetical protein